MEKKQRGEEEVKREPRAEQGEGDGEREPRVERECAGEALRTEKTFHHVTHHDTRDAEGRIVRTTTTVTTTVETVTQVLTSSGPTPAVPVVGKDWCPPLPEEERELPPLPVQCLEGAPVGVVSSQDFRVSSASRQVVLQAGLRNTMEVVYLSSAPRKRTGSSSRQLVFARQLAPGVDKVEPIKPLRKATTQDRNVGAHRVHVSFVCEVFLHRVPLEGKTQKVMLALRDLVNHPDNFTVRTQRENMSERPWENQILRVARPNPPPVDCFPWENQAFCRKVRDMRDGMRALHTFRGNEIHAWCILLLEHTLCDLFRTLESLHGEEKQGTSSWEPGAAVPVERHTASVS